MFEEASGGTLFLDEIGELPLALQVKLLRVLQEEEIRRLGDTQDIQVDVRVVAATARDLGAEVARGSFREDLFYRLNVVHLELPPLRERREDIPLLVSHFVERMNARMGLHIAGVSPEAMRRLMEHEWPGNVRELENTIERAMVLTDTQQIDVDALSDRIGHGSQRTPAAGRGPQRRRSFHQAGLPPGRGGADPAGPGQDRGKPHQGRGVAGDQPPRAAV